MRSVVKGSWKPMRPASNIWSTRRSIRARNSSRGRSRAKTRTPEAGRSCPVWRALSGRPVAAPELDSVAVGGAGVGVVEALAEHAHRPVTGQAPALGGRLVAVVQLDRRAVRRAGVRVVEALPEHAEGAVPG